jgi:hypothetical protein
MKESKLLVKCVYGFVVIATLLTLCFSTYVIFIEKTDAAMFKCGSYISCQRNGQPCNAEGASISCGCSLTPFVNCSFFNPIY